MGETRTPVSDCPAPYPVQFQGSRWARGVLRLFGWQVLFQGLPARQGVLAVYPHTSNWDFIVMILAKWAVGVPVRFWGKDTLFAVPLLGRWLRWLGGVPVDRHNPRGVVGQAVDHVVACKQADRYFWLGLAPEGTRKPSAGWRSGFYQTAHGAGVPLGLIRLDYGQRTVSVLDFIVLGGDEAHDMARIAAIYDGVRGLRPAWAAPVRLVPHTPRTDTISP